MTTDRHEAECARVEAEFNSDDVEIEVTIEELLTIILHRLDALEARLDDLSAWPTTPTS